VHWLKGLLLLISAFSMTAAGAQSIDNQFLARHVESEIPKVYAELKAMQKLARNQADIPPELFALFDSKMAGYRFAQLVMGSYAREARPEQIQRFHQRIRADFVKISRDQLIKVDLNALHMPTVKASRRGKRLGVTLNVEIKPGISVPVLVSFIEDKKGDPQVLNMVFAGINLGKILQTQFQAAVLLNGGNIDRTIDQWKPFLL